MELVASAGDEFGQPLTVRAGIATGDVASGVIGEQQVTFSVWGEPVSMAFTLASLALPGEVLVDAVVSEGVGSQWTIEPREGLAGLDDNIEAWTIRLSQPAGS
jgi:class 3 adenylate cyclase